MTIFVNGQSVTTSALCVAELHSELGLGQMVAIAINNSVVPHDKWAETPLAEDDKVVIIKMAFGG